MRRTVSGISVTARDPPLLLSRQSTYREAVANDFDQRGAAHTRRRGIQDLERQGYRVTIEPAAWSVFSEQSSLVVAIIAVLGFAALTLAALVLILLAAVPALNALRDQGGLTTSASAADFHSCADGLLTL